MQITFDPRDRNSCASVIATIAALHGSLPFDEIAQNGYGPDGFVTAGGQVPPPTAEQDAAFLSAMNTEIDPAEAFGAQSPEQAFPAAPAAPIAAPATQVTSAPAGTQVNGTAPATPAIGSDNGPNAATAASPSSVELDADGLPWDGRIHSGPADKRPKNADGTWRRKRGTDDGLVASVTAELRQVMGAPAPVPTPPAAPVVASPEPAPAVAPIPAPPAPVPTPPVAVTESGPAAASPAPSFAELMRKITQRQTAGTLTVEATGEIAKALGLVGVRDLINRPDLVAAFDALLPE